jgi:short-subunit dehydrogenase
MAKIFQFGATSELASSVSQAILNLEPDKQYEVVKIGRTLVNGFTTHLWKTGQPNDIENSFKDLCISKGDIVIIGVGFLGGIRSTSNLDLVNSDEIYETISVSAALAASVYLGALREFKKVGGGRVIVFTSVAAHPVLESNSIYGESKNLLEKIISNSRKSARDAGVHVCVVRNSFAPTKMNQLRKKTPFSTTSKRVGETVSLKSYKKVVWIPHVWKYISILIRFIPGLRQLSNLAIRKSL